MAPDRITSQRTLSGNLPPKTEAFNLPLLLEALYSVDSSMSTLLERRNKPPPTGLQASAFNVALNK